LHPDNEQNYTMIMNVAPIVENENKTQLFSAEFPKDLLGKCFRLAGHR